ncbi:MAG TPA: cytochrome c [Candidatus Binataceae bacterium]|nr:cytochrome c [Candidatus Binataceae bacterium]
MSITKSVFGAFAALALTVTAAASAKAADMAAAKQSYDTFCVKCHGAGGQGDGPAAATLATKPRNFTDCAVMGKLTDDTLFNVIKNGGASLGLSKDMQAWSTGFADGEIHDLVAYVRAFCKK